MSEGNPKELQLRQTEGERDFMSKWNTNELHPKTTGRWMRFTSKGKPNELQPKTLLNILKCFFFSWNLGFLEWEGDKSWTLPWLCCKNVALESYLGYFYILCGKMCPNLFEVFGF